MIQEESTAARHKSLTIPGQVYPETLLVMKANTGVRFRHASASKASPIEETGVVSVLFVAWVSESNPGRL